MKKPGRHIKILFATDHRQTTTTDRQMKLRSNTHGCELIRNTNKIGFYQTTWEEACDKAQNIDIRKEYIKQS